MSEYTPIDETWQPTDAAVQESFMYAQLACRDRDTNELGTALTVSLSRAYDRWLTALKADVRKDALVEARRIVDGPHPANSGLDSFTLAWVSAALGDAPTGRPKQIDHEPSQFGCADCGLAAPTGGK